MLKTATCVLAAFLFSSGSAQAAAETGAPGGESPSAAPASGEASTPQAPTAPTMSDEGASHDAALDAAEQHGLCARTLAVAASQSRDQGRDQLADTYSRLSAQETELALAGGADARMFGGDALTAVRAQLDRDPLDFLAVLEMCLDRHGMTLKREAEKDRFPDWPQATRQGYTFQPEDLEID